MAKLIRGESQRRIASNVVRISRRSALGILASGLLAAGMLFHSSPMSALAAPGPATFGVNAHLLWYGVDAAVADLDKVQKAGLHRVRYDLDWSTLEPVNKGSYDMAFVGKLDNVVEQAQSRGIQSTIVLVATPAWARDNVGSLLTPPNNADDFADAAAFVAARYANVPGMAYEIWNEPNQARFWDTLDGPDAAVYAQLLVASYPRIKSVAPNAVVLGGSIAFNDEAYLTDLYTIGRAQGSFDALSIHPYSRGYAPSSTASTFASFALAISNLQQVMASYGDADKPIRITEMGWSTNDVPDATRASHYAEAVSMVKTRPYIVEFDAYALNQAEDFPDMGLMSGDGVPTSSWTAYLQAVQQP